MDRLTEAVTFLDELAQRPDQKTRVQYVAKYLQSLSREAEEAMTSRPAAPESNWQNCHLTNCNTQMCCAYPKQCVVAALPESETPEVDPDIEKLMNLAHELWDDGLEDSNKIIVECCEQIQRRLSLAQTEIKGHMRVEDELKAELREAEEALRLIPIDWQNQLEAAQARIAELEKLLSDALENLIWCGGSADFGWGGKAQVGYDKGPRTTIAAIDAALKDRA